MCGVAGIIDFQSRLNNTPAVADMLRSIVHRGPDETGIYHSSVTTLGNVRLSIIDPGSGQQPMSDKTGRFIIVFNGEIFNYVELKAGLEKRGHCFKTMSDTEVLLQLFIDAGKECLGMLNGQFVFAIWDNLEQKIFIARDRVGIRPLYYHTGSGALAFASEIKALLTLKYVPRELNHRAITQIFTFWTAIAPSTPFRDINELPPGHFLTYDSKGLRTERYWQMNFIPEEINISLPDAIDRFDELFTNAVRIRMRADVEVAAYLSGGIDSSATVAYIKDIEPGILNTFSIGFSEKDFDESRYQDEAAGYFGTRHLSYLCSSSEIAKVFPDVIWHSEMPLTRTAPAPMLLLSRLVRDNNIKVVVTGEGSDEFLAGYDIFKELYIRNFWALSPDSRIRPLLLKRLYPYIPHIAQANPVVLKMFFGYKLTDTGNPFYSHLIRWNNANHIKKHFSSSFTESTAGYEPVNELAETLPAEFCKFTPLGKAQWLESTIFMSGYLLSSQGDRMAMANSVEGRYPFLDHRLIEFCNSLPENYKLKGLTEKYLLKKVLDGKVPDSIIRRTKQPYRAPSGNLFLAADRPEYIGEMLSEDYFNNAGIFSYSSLQSVLQKIEKSGVTSETDDMLLTAVISTHLLHHLFINNRKEDYETVDLKNLRIIRAQEAAAD